MSNASWHAGRRAERRIAQAILGRMTGLSKQIRVRPCIKGAFSDKRRAALDARLKRLLTFAQIDPPNAAHLRRLHQFYPEQEARRVSGKIGVVDGEPGVEHVS